MARQASIAISKVVSGVKQPDIGRTVKIIDLAGNFITGAATETPTNSGQYSAAWSESATWGYWNVDNTTKYDDSSPFWLGVTGVLSGSNVSVRRTITPQISASGDSSVVMDLQAAGPASIRYLNGTDYWQSGHGSSNQFLWNYNGSTKFTFVPTNFNGGPAVGIGKAPVWELDVKGSAAITGGITSQSLSTGGITATNLYAFGPVGLVTNNISVADMTSNAITSTTISATSITSKGLTSIGKIDVIGVATNYGQIRIESNGPNNEASIGFKGLGELNIDNTWLIGKYIDPSSSAFQFFHTGSTRFEIYPAGGINVTSTLTAGGVIRTNTVFQAGISAGATTSITVSAASPSRNVTLRFVGGILTGVAG